MWWVILALFSFLSHGPVFGVQYSLPVNMDNGEGNVLEGA